MKIIGLKADGYKKLNAIEMKFKENGFTFIKGNNEQGKTSILDCIEYLFRGKSKINTQSIGHGKDKINAEIDLGEYIIKRIQTDKSDRLEIRDKKGFKLDNKPQAFLDTLINDLTFDPFPFLNKTAKEKLKFMMDFLNINFDEIDMKIKEIEEERTFIGRQGKELGKPVETEKVEKIDVIELIKERDEMIKFNHTIDSKIDTLNLMIDEEHLIKNTIENMKQEIRKAEGNLEELQKEIKAYPSPELRKDFTFIENNIESSEEINKKANQYNQYIEHKKKYDELQEKYGSITESIELLRIDKLNILKQTKTGIDGLEIKEDGLYFNDTFSENWSDSEGIKISCMLSQIMKPELKSIFIDRGESFDEKTLKEIEIWANKNDIQCIITKVESLPGNDEIPDNVYYIEEGKIK